MEISLLSQGVTWKHDSSEPSINLCHFKYTPYSVSFNFNLWRNMVLIFLFGDLYRKEVIRNILNLSHDELAVVFELIELCSVPFWTFPNLRISCTKFCWFCSFQNFLDSKGSCPRTSLLPYCKACQLSNCSSLLGLPEPWQLHQTKT